MRRTGTALVFILVVLLLCSGLRARPTTADEAGMAVTGWLKSSTRPLGMALGRSVISAFSTKLYDKFDSGARSPVPL